MPKPKAALAAAAALPFLLIAACGGPEQGALPNGAAEAEEAGGANGVENSVRSDPVQPGTPGQAAAEPAAPPDAVSHPDGYLPPAPAEPGPSAGNNSASPGSAPATEDEYLRNGQAGR